ncbi:hypothetical protein FA95DRAFT_218493 [Auriscalpium vulgare]|uniref:Uncharacterized protein n=1 Tax=Auriscalpium vulgare TaxID=40419 RepID=A0ACB8RLJ9_9AGAM|nr:hypothetical protein FA95DRAFT_218493 [Auriscalpium vulgare]
MTGGEGRKIDGVRRRAIDKGRRLGESGRVPRLPFMSLLGPAPRSWNWTPPSSPRRPRRRRRPSPGPPSGVQVGAHASLEAPPRLVDVLRRIRHRAAVLRTRQRRGLRTACAVSANQEMHLLIGRENPDPGEISAEGTITFEFLFVRRTRPTASRPPAATLLSRSLLCCLPRSSAAPWGLFDK